MRIAYLGAILCATLLQFGPFNVFDRLASIWENAVVLPWDTSEVPRISVRLKQTIQERDQLCDLAEATYPPTAALPVGTQRVVSNAASPADLALENFKSTRQEIHDRILQQQVLFVLKFTFLGSILAAFFTLLRRGERIETVARMRRAATFFSCALLVAGVIDAGLRFDAKIMETLGAYAWCVERATASGGMPFWEHFLVLEMERGVFPLLRHFTVLLTLLLFGVVLFGFLELPTGAHRKALHILLVSIGAWFGMLVFIGASYAGANHLPPVFGPAVSLSIGITGTLLSWWAIRLKEQIGDVLAIVDPLARKLRKLVGKRGAESENAFVRAWNIDAAFLAELAVAEECIALIAKRRKRPNSANVSGEALARSLAHAIHDDVGLAETFLWGFYDEARQRLAGGFKQESSALPEARISPRAEGRKVPSKPPPGLTYSSPAPIEAGVASPSGHGNGVSQKSEP